ncbi:hypothetical protein [Parasphingorhabdus pacifica]
MAEARLPETRSATERHREQNRDHGPVASCIASLDAVPETHLDTVLMAAAFEYPEAVAPFRPAFAEFPRVSRESTEDPTLGTLLRLASDGLWPAELVGLDVLEQNERAAVFPRVMTLAAEEDGPPPESKVER